MTRVCQNESKAVDVRAFIDPERPQSWSRQMIGLLRAGHYREGYEILADKMPFVENQLRPYAERLAGRENYWTRTFGWLSRFIDGSGPLRILDVGCGIGPIAIEFAQQGHRTWGIDILPSMIERGRELVEALELSERVHLVEGDIRHLEGCFEGGFFDAAVACDIFEHVEDDGLGAVLASLGQVVRPGGAIVIQTSPGRYYYWFEPSRRKLLGLLVPMAWLPDGAFSAYVHWLERWPLRKVRQEHVRFYHHEPGHTNCMDHHHLSALMKAAELENVRTFAVHAHRGFKDEGCLRARWTRSLFGSKSAACRNVFGTATTPVG